MMLVRFLVILFALMWGGTAHAQQTIGGPPIGQSGGLNTNASNAVVPTAASNLIPGFFRTGTLSPAKGWGFNDDLLQLNSTDPSLITYITPTGTPTATETPGVTWKINNTTFTITYTVQAGDSTNALVGAGLADCLSATPVNPSRCSSTPSDFRVALTAVSALISQNGVAGVNAAGRVAIDVPWSTGATTCPVAASSANTTITVTGCTVLDNDPQISMQRNVVGRTPVSLDQVGCLYFNGQSTSNSGLDTNYAQICGFVTAQDASNPQGKLSLLAAGPASAKATALSFDIVYNGIIMPQSNYYTWSQRSVIGSSGDGIIDLFNNAGSSFTRLDFGGTTSSFPAIKRNAAALNFRLADDSADAAITAGAATFSARTNFGVGSGAPAHIATAQTTAPALTSCGTGSPTITGTDTAGIVTMGTTATGCALIYAALALNSGPASASGSAGGFAGSGAFVAPSERMPQYARSAASARPSSFTRVHQPALAGMS